MAAARARRTAALTEVIAEWKARAGATDRVPEGWDQILREEPDSEVLTGAGFELLGKSEIIGAHT